MSDNNPLTRLAKKLAARIGGRYVVEIENRNIYVFIPDSDLNREQKFMELRGYLSEMNDENISALNLQVLYNDEDKLKRAPHRVLVDVLQKRFPSIPIGYNTNVIEITLPDDKDGSFIKTSLSILNIIRDFIATTPIRLSQTINVRFKRSYRDLNFKIDKSETTELVPLGAFSDLELLILYKLANTTKTTEFVTTKICNASDSDLSAALQNLEEKGILETDYDFLSGGFYNEGETPQTNYPAGYQVKLADDKLKGYLKE